MCRRTKSWKCSECKTFRGEPGGAFSKCQGSFSSGTEGRFIITWVLFCNHAVIIKFNLMVTFGKISKKTLHIQTEVALLPFFQTWKTFRTDTVYVQKKRITTECQRKCVFVFIRGHDSRFTSAVLRSSRSSFKRFMSSFLMCLGDCSTSSWTYSAFSKTGWSCGNLPKAKGQKARRGCIPPPRSASLMPSELPAGFVLIRQPHHSQSQLHLSVPNLSKERNQGDIDEEISVKISFPCLSVRFITTPVEADLCASEINRGTEMESSSMFNRLVAERLFS